MTREVVIALIAIALLAAIDEGPFAGLSSQRTVGESSPSVTGPASPRFFFWFVFVGEASCSLATGVCTTTIVNDGTNSSYNLAVDRTYLNTSLMRMRLQAMRMNPMNEETSLSYLVSILLNDFIQLKKRSTV